MRFVILFQLLITVGRVTLAYSQTAPGVYWVKFADKDNSPFSLQEPHLFLSAVSIDRRITHQIGFDSLDLPVNPHYVNELRGVGNLTIRNKSKWFNAVTIEVVDTLLLEGTLDAIDNLSFVTEIRRVKAIPNPNPGTKMQDVVLPNLLKGDVAFEAAEYGPSYRQISMLNGHLLHQLGYRGRGLRIAVFDGGWDRTDVLPAFEILREEGRIVSTRDFVSPDEQVVYGKSNHGTFVLSHMAAIIPDSLIGTAPEASYYLFRTEDVGSEYLVEEDNWVAAAEAADSIGIDLINSSLAYSEFDDESTNHTYESMDGNTTRCSIAADLASSKGILVINSAGNSGRRPWRYITAPSDGDLVMAVGAVDQYGSHAPFSSYGPSSDEDVKPNVMAMGMQTVFADLDSTISRGNGTSFSAPIITGLAACLWQAFPEKSGREIFNAIQSSAHLLAVPNDSMGFGIPDFWRAFQLLREDQVVPTEKMNARLYPNPARDFVQVTFYSQRVDQTCYSVYDSEGKLTLSGSGFSYLSEKEYGEGRVDISSLRPGYYTIVLDDSLIRTALPFCKIDFP